MVVVSSSVSLFLFHALALLIIKSFEILRDNCKFFISPFISVGFCFKVSKALLLGTYLEFLGYLDELTFYHYTVSLFIPCSFLGFDVYLAINTATPIFFC